MAKKTHMWVGETTKEELIEFLPDGCTCFFIFEEVGKGQVAIHAFLPVDSEDNLRDVLRAAVVADALEDNTSKVARRHPGLLASLKLRLKRPDGGEPE